MAVKSTDSGKRKSTAELLREKKVSAYLEQIRRDEALVNLLLGEQSSLTGESLLHLPVSHKQFGSGQVVNQDQLTISVQFSDRVRRFPSPQAFLDGFLQTEDAGMAHRLTRYREIKNQITLAKKAISDADHAIALLKK